MEITEALKTDIPHPQPKDKLRMKEAMGIFIRVSTEYPADPIAQAARIAQLCKRSKEGILTLGEALLGDSEALDSIVKAGNARHRNAGRAIIIDQRIVKETIEDDFETAFKMRSASEKQLETILDAYRNKTSPSDDKEERRLAIDLIRKLQMQR